MTSDASVKMQLELLIGEGWVSTCSMNGLLLIYVLNASFRSNHDDDVDL